MLRLTLEFLRQAVDRRVTDFRVELIKVSGSPSTVHRVSLDYGGSPPVGAARSLVAKHIAPEWAQDPAGRDRERFAYSRILPQLDIPKCRVYYSGEYPGQNSGEEPVSQYRLVLLADVSDRYAFPHPQHVWTWDEMRSIMAGYAHLHAAGIAPARNLPTHDWLWMGHSKSLAPESVLRQAADLHAWGVWPTLPPLEPMLQHIHELAESLAGQLCTVLHNDAYPPNIGIPQTPDEPCLLLDWEMLGTGPAEFDLAYMFMLPYRSTRHIERSRALDAYWDARYALDGTLKSRDEREAAQWYADARWSLYELSVAHKVAQKPFASGSSPANYWEQMHPILHEQFMALCAVPA